MNIKIINIILLLFLSTNVIGQTESENDKTSIIIKTEKLVYNKNDSIKLIIANISKDTLYAYRTLITHGSLRLQRLANDSIIEMNILFPSGIRGQSKKPFLPSDTISYIWTGRLADHYSVDSRTIFSKAPKGTYRFLFNYWEELDLVLIDTVINNQHQYFDNDINYIYSEKFEIR